MDNAFLSFISNVEKCKNELKCSNSGAFYRGHSSNEHSLIPSLLRNSISQNLEHNIYHEMFARAGGMIPRSSTSWERLAFLQHYGVPTRLLDWTESFAIALFFALNPTHKNPHIWVVNAFNINRSSPEIGRPRILMAGLDAFPDYYECFVEIDNRKPWPYKKPIFLQVPWTTDRMRAQMGFFSFHNNETPLEHNHHKYIRKIHIPEDAIPGAMKFLSLSGINEHNVFPDFIGFSSFLRRRYKI